MIGVERNKKRDNNYNYNYNYNYNPFTEKQWEELENQVLTFRYLMSGVPVPPSLMSSLITTSSSTSTLFPHPQQSLPFGLSCFQVGYGYGHGYGRKVDPEPGRCKRTDGKKWRCTKEAHPDSKYCEKHMHRSKNKSKAKKQFDALNNTSTTKSLTDINPSTTTTSPATSNSYLPYPTVSYRPVLGSNYHDKYQGDGTSFYSIVPARSSSNGGMSIRDESASSHWLGLDGGLHDKIVKQETRYSSELLDSEASKVTSTGGFEDVGYKYKIVGEEEHGDKKHGGDKEDETQKLYHHFLGDWPSKLRTSPTVGLFSRSN